MAESGAALGAWRSVYRAGMFKRRLFQRHQLLHIRRHSYFGLWKGPIPKNRNSGPQAPVSAAPYCPSAGPVPFPVCSPGCPGLCHGVDHRKPHGADHAAKGRPSNLRHLSCSGPFRPPPDGAGRVPGILDFQRASSCLDWDSHERCLRHRHRCIAVYCPRRSDGVSGSHRLTDWQGSGPAYIPCCGRIGADHGESLLYFKLGYAAELCLHDRTDSPGRSVLPCHCGQTEAFHIASNSPLDCSTPVP